MSKSGKALRSRDATRNLGKELLQAVREMKTGRRGRAHKVAVPPLVAARLKSGLSQARFAHLLGVSVRTLQDWEQARREPSGAAKTLILIAAKRPDVLRALLAA